MGGGFIAVIAAFGLIAAFLAVILHQYKPEYAMLLAAGAGCGILFLLLSAFSPAIEQLQALLGRAGLSMAYFKILLKGLGICYLSQFAGDLCRDAGQTSLAGKVELAGKLSIVLLALPAAMDITEWIFTLLE